jgi:uncharacterized repeat protein (TIGR03809 family)
MTYRPDVARRHDVMARWCALAEQRLEHLTELFETGRWRRYHSELAFLENIQEAKAAVETWRDLSRREAARDHSALDISWPGHDRAMPTRSETLRERFHRPPSPSLKIVAELPRNVASTAAETDHVFADEAPSAPAMDNASDPALDIDAIGRRYPLLRNAL